jgi:hypothetical protein
MSTNCEPNTLTTVDLGEQQSVEGGVLAVEYLLVATIVVLGAITGLTLR